MRLLRELGWVERHDTHLATRFRAAGFVFLGRTNVPELGPAPTTEPLAYGPTRNPSDTSRAPGGSSGGSAAAVAAGLVPVAHANDGGGSIRIPSSECGLVGLKPSRGRTSLGPDVGEGWGGLSVEHVVARSVRDTAAVLDAVAGYLPGDPYTAPPPARPFRDEVGAGPGKLRVGLLVKARAGRRLRRRHHALQRHRAAGHLAPAPLEHRRPPDRRPARRRLRARGPAPPHRGPARGGASVERAAPAGARVSDDAAAWQR